MKRNNRQRTAVRAESFETRLMPSTTPVLVADLIPGSASPFPDSLINVGGTLFFAASDAGGGRELWKSNGTSAGTVRVLDIRSGSQGSNPENLTVVNGILFFTADDGVSGRELWKSDGTTAGTARVLDIEPGTVGSEPNYLTNVSGTLFFAAKTSSSGTELWKTNGTAAGTVKVSEINAGSNGSYPKVLSNVGGSLLFVAYTPAENEELWKSDGTSAGTTMVKAIIPGGESPGIRSMGVAGNTAYFSAFRPESGYELWKSDGTAAGTLLVRDIFPGTYEDYGQLYNNNSLPGEFANLNGVLHFTATTSNNGTLSRPIWRTNGTSAGTTVVHEFANQQQFQNFNSLQNVNGSLHFAYNRSIYRSDGTSAGITLLADGSQFSSNADFLQIVRAHNLNYFVESTTAAGRELWKSDGTAAGTVMAFDLNPGTSGSDIHSLTEVNGSLFFVATNGSTGQELWRVSPETAPTVAPTISNPAATTGLLRPNIVWSSVDGATRYEVWIKNQSTNVNPYRVVTVNSNSFLTETDFGIGLYNVWVRAGNNAGWGPWSAQYNFQINTRVSTNDPGRFLGTHRPQLSWQSLPGAVRYDLWVNNKSANVSQFIRNSNITSTNFTPSSDLPIGTYEAWVRGIDASGLPGTWSSTMLFNVVPPPVVTQGNQSTFDRSPLFEWQELAGAVKYEVFLRNLLSGATVFYQQNIAGLSYQVPTDLTDGPYRWWLLGVSAQNIRSFWTNPIDIYIGGRTEVLSPAGTAPSATPVFTWKPVGGAQRYDLWVDRVGGPTQIIREQNLLSTQFTPAAPLPAGTFRMWVRAISTSGETSPWSLTAQFSVASTVTPDLQLLPAPESTDSTPEVPIATVDDNIEKEITQTPPEVDAAIADFHLWVVAGS